MVKNIAIIIPSYNEVKNLSILIGSIKKELPNATIYIVDDSSEIENKKLKKIVNNKKNIILLSRLKKSGRGSAVIDGFKEALKNKKLQYFFEMDSDLAHDPREFKRFLSDKKIDNYDLVIGSRYLPGGKIINIASNRTIMSRVINKFLYYWLGIHLSDHTSGFRLYRRKAVEFLVKEKIEAKGFIALSETAYKLFLANFKITEVPITWNFRVYGKSNVNPHELYSSLFFVIKMRLKHILKKYYKLILAILFIFFIAFFLRINTLNQMGRTWDEPIYVQQGYKMVQLIKKGDFSNSFFYTTYDHPPLAKYLYGLSAKFDLNNSEINTFNYDYTYSRTLSALFGSLSAVLILLIAWEFASPFIAISSSLIFSMLPFFIGLSQLVSTESMLMFFFTSAVYAFIKMLKKFSIKLLLLTGILVGLALGVKQSNILLFPIFGLIYLLWYFLEGKFKEKIFNLRFASLFLIIIISAVTFFIIWPMPYFHLDYISKINQQTWLVKTAPPEVFWGKLIQSPVIYFVTFFFITTPLLIILLSLLGLMKMNRKNNWIWYSFVIWFLFPFIQSFYVWRVHGLRYIIEIYAPLSIIAGLGLSFIIEKLHLGKKSKILSLFLIFIYLIILIYQIKPYYLDYYNELVGGSYGIYKSRYFELGWWGQGLRDASIYLKDYAKPNSKIGLYVSLPQSFPNINNQNIIYNDPNDKYNPLEKYNYVVVNNYHVLREGFDDSQIKLKYKLIYQVTAGGASIVDIYEKK